MGQNRVHILWWSLSGLRFAEPQPAFQTTEMMSLRTVIAIVASLLAMAQALPTPPDDHFQRRPVRSADDLKTSASYGYGYGYGYGLGYPYGGLGWGGYGGYAYGYPYYSGVYHSYPFGYGYGGYYGYPGFGWHY